MTLDEATQKLVQTYFDKFDKKIKKIESGKKANYIVCDADFHAPTLLPENVPLDDELGEHFFYSSIRDGLQMALDEGYISRREFGGIMRRAPQDLQELFDAPNKYVG